MSRSQQAFNSRSENSLRGFHGASFLEPEAAGPAAATTKPSRPSHSKATSEAPPALTCLPYASGARERSLHSAVLLFDSDEARLRCCLSQRDGTPHPYLPLSPRVAPPHCDAARCTCKPNFDLIAARLFITAQGKADGRKVRRPACSHLRPLT